MQLLAGTLPQNELLGSGCRGRLLLCTAVKQSKQPQINSVPAIAKPKTKLNGQNVDEQNKAVQYTSKSQVKYVQQLQKEIGEDIGPVPKPDQNFKEPSLSEILVAIAIGLGTGGAVVLFNTLVHEIQHWIWQGFPQIGVPWDQWVRAHEPREIWRQIVLPPVVAGLAVGLLRASVNGFEATPTITPPPPITPPSNPPMTENQPETPDNNSNSTKVASDVTDPPTASQQPPQDNSARKGYLEDTADQFTTPFQSLNTQIQQNWRSVALPVAKALAAAVTLGSGASLGPEGPSVELGKSVAKGVGLVLKESPNKNTMLIAAGSGAGVAAGFNAPIAGIFFAVETVLLRQSNSESKDGIEVQSADVLTTVLLACVAAAAVSQAGLGFEPAFSIPEYDACNLSSLPLYLLFGWVCGSLSQAFLYTSSYTSGLVDEVQKRASIPAVLLPAIGGLICGLIALKCPEITYQGFNNVNTILKTRGPMAYTPDLLLTILGLKVVATSLCRAFGLVGGLYAPSIFMGASLGVVMGSLSQAVTIYNPEVATMLQLNTMNPQALALVGLACTLAGICKVPLTAILLLFELTHDYNIIIPTLGAVGISFWVAALPARKAQMEGN